MNRIPRTLAFSSLTILLQIALPGGVNRVHAQWYGFLGPGGNPVLPSTVLPERFSVASDDQPAENIAWRTPLPGRSVSGPVVVDGKVITTGSSAMEGRWLHTSAVDAATGKLLWHRSLRCTGRPHCHPTSANAAPSPCTDGRQIYAFFSSNDLACYDLEGNLVWFRSLVDAHPLAGNDVGMSSSPVVVDGVVVVVVEGQGDSFAAGIEAATGQTRWEIKRPQVANWSSPRLAYGADGSPVVVIHNGQGAMGIVPRDGQVAWQLELRCSTIASAVFAEDKLFLPADGVHAYQLAGPRETPVPLWRAGRISPASSSLMVVKDLGLLGLNRSVLVCCDFAGELKWQLRLPDAGQFWSTPVVAGRRLVAMASNGKCFVVDLTDSEGRLVSQCELGTEVLGSPAMDSTGMYVRSVDALWKIRS
ncbi:MAG: PQQ-binding-like beta-propeller repeat protein [Pirellulaceae bacterium]|nr:PQQ-binding-like beta-propeller repeat protein [Pirellulaceae bacterium]